MTPQVKANKTLVYYQATKHAIKLTDRGDIINVSWTQDPSTHINIDIYATAEDILAKLHKFFGSRPKNL